MGPVKYNCSKCLKSYYKQFIITTNSDNDVCTFCDLRSAINGELNLLKEQLLIEKNERASDVAALKVEIAQLKSKLESVEFNSNNKPNDIASSTQTDTYASKVSDVSSPLCHPPSPPTPLNDNFIPVKRGLKPKKLDLPCPIPTKNAFSVFQESCSANNETNAVLVGDSMFHGQEKEFSNQQKTKVYSYGGSSLTGKKRLGNHIDDFTQAADRNTLFVIHVGTNDLLDRKSTSDEILIKYKQLLQSIRDKTLSSRICVLGLFPVLYESLNETSERKLLNELLHEMANDENILFLSVWEQFARDINFKSFFNSGGLHLNHFGSAKLSNMLSDLIRNFQTIPLYQTTD